MENKQICTTETKLIYTVEDIQQIFEIGKTCAIIDKIIPPCYDIENLNERCELHNDEQCYL